MSAIDEVLFKRRGAVGFITLNRPKSLNALTLEMIRAIDPQLDAWGSDNSIAAVVIQGVGDRAFCSGGDVLAIWQAGKSAKARGVAEGLATEFFREEYRLNRRIHRFPKPYIALIDGITMGGGVGLSIHGTFRVATERTRFAMPETAIGLFPDVGGGYFLPRLPGQIGRYLALSGARLKAADCLHSGLANAFVESADLTALEAALAQADWTGEAAEVAKNIIAGFSKDPGKAPLAAQQAQIDRIFGSETLDDILAALMAEEGDWAAETLKVLQSHSPTSMKVALEQLRRGSEIEFDEAMTMEYRMSQAFMAGHDFYEGVRAILIDRDQAPKWDPATPDGVSEEVVARHFETLGPRELTFS
ncbi:enoyl-CoA hydratase/isomerase family protein [Pelagibius sp. Alg239-R121]|uniref:enoyl-CoA hydratase/isomerase family protein n=1 Tax=Pelagibius sp. Alg239-R121 TaxID=2993448 RepID=UPI0024A72EBE|nr:enoyl-CoA hydratase/isomerase family protein [Pelagibius sp. Alg239-R121]